MQLTPQATCSYGCGCVRSQFPYARMSVSGADLPHGVIQNISSYLSWTDVLAVRATAHNWASALAPVVTRLRVPLVNPTSLHKRPAAAGADEKADADAAKLTSASTAEHVAHASASQLEAQPHLVEQLSAVLERLPNVDSITLVLSTATTGPDLEGALQVIGRKERVDTVTICEVGQPPAESAGERLRDYVPGLKLQYLRSVRVLKLKTLSWTLAEIWEQVDELHSSHCSSSGGAAPAHVADVAGSSRGSSGMEGPAGSSGRGYALHTLVIEQLPSCLLRRVCCTLRDKQLPTQLTHLTTPLPGQYSTCRHIVGPLNTQHQQYLEQLAAALPQLESLTVTDQYQGSEHVLTQHFSRLSELNIVFGDVFRSYPSEFLGPDHETTTFELASRMVNLQQMCLLPQRMLPSKGLQGPLLSTRHMLGVLGRDSGVEITPYKLDWLQFNTQLQHLAAPLLQTGEDVSAYNGQLRSLVGECNLAATELLQQVASVGSALTSLALYKSDTQATPGYLEGFVFLTPLVPAGRAISALTNLHSLTLMGTGRTQYELTDPDSVWSQLPALRSLKLQNVSLRSAAGTCLPVDLWDTVTLLGSNDSRSNRRVLWLSYLPCEQLTQLELSRYHIILQSDVVNRAAGAQGCSSSHGSGSGSSRHAVDLSGLKHLALTDCGCLLLQPQAARTQPDPEAAQSAEQSSRSSLPALLQQCGVSPPSSEAVPTGLQPLLSKLIAPGSHSSNLRTLQLNYLTLGLSDVHDIMCSSIGLQLQQLHITNCEVLSSDNSEAPGDDMLAHVVEAAAAAGHLRELRCLVLLLKHECDLPGGTTAASSRDGSQVRQKHLLPSLGTLASCCSLQSLQQLYLLLKPGAVAAGTPACSCISTPRAVLGPGGVGEHLPKLQHVQELMLVLLCVDGEAEPGPEGQATGHQEVVGYCSDCGHAVSCSQLKEWLYSVGPGLLPGCNIDVELRAAAVQ